MNEELIEKEVVEVKAKPNRKRKHSNKYNAAVDIVVEEPEVLEIEFEPFEFDGALVVLTLTLLFEVE